MNKPKVLVSSKIPNQVEAYISTFCDYEIWDKEEPIPREELLEKIKDKVGLLGVGIGINEELLEQAPYLKVVSNISVGYNNFDLEAMKSRKVIGTNTAGALDETVADLIFGLMLASSRRICELDQYVKKGQWKKEDNVNLFGVDVHGATLGVIGMGRIGEAVAKRAKCGFDMKVQYYNRTRKYETEELLGVSYCSFEELLKTSDFIVLMLPLTEATYHIIDTKEFELMKKEAIFINASRGQTVNEEALIEALRTGEIRGAGLDVYEAEPILANNPLLEMPHVVTVPHIGSATASTRLNMAMTAAKNLQAALAGQMPPQCVPELKV
jgi:gluconate 2-dehydrogenase